MLTIKRSEFVREVPLDPSGSVEGNPARGLRVAVTLHIPDPDFEDHYISLRIDSPGVWGIEDSEETIRDVCDPSADYWEDLWEEQERILAHMLAIIGVQVGG